MENNDVQKTSQESILQILSPKIIFSRLLSVFAFCISIFSLIYIVCKWNDYKDEINKPFLYMVSDTMDTELQSEPYRWIKAVDRTYTMIRYKLRQVETYPVSNDANIKKHSTQMTLFKSSSPDIFIPILDFGKYKVDGHCMMNLPFNFSSNSIVTACICIVDSNGDFKETLLEGPQYQISDSSSYSIQPFIVNGIIQLYGKGQYSIGCFLKIRSNKEQDILGMLTNVNDVYGNDKRPQNNPLLNKLECTLIISRLI